MFAIVAVPYDHDDDDDDDNNNENADEFPDRAGYVKEEFDIFPIDYVVMNCCLIVWLVLFFFAMIVYLVEVFVVFFFNYYNCALHDKAPIQCLVQTVIIWP